MLVEVVAVEPGDGFREPLGLVGPYPSGAPAIFADQVAKLGQPCGMIGCVGADDFGALIVDRLRADGVDVAAVGRSQDHTTGAAFVRYRPDGERDFVYYIRDSASAELELTAEAERLLTECGHLHIMGSSLFSPSIIALAEQAVDRVKSAGGTFSFDPNLRKEMLVIPGLLPALHEMARRCDVFLPSSGELAAMTEDGDEPARIAEMLEDGVSCVIVKRGADGATYYSRTETLELPGYPVEQLDPTGAGDCFDATFTTCWLQGRSVEESLRYANASGASAVAVRGPMEGTTCWAELDAFIALAAAMPE